MISHHCPSCDVLIKSPDRLAGRRGECPCCDEPLRIPGIRPRLRPPSESRVSRDPWIRTRLHGPALVLTLAFLALATSVVLLAQGRPCSREDFDRAFLGATQGEVRARLGAPEVVGGDAGGGTIWAYHGQARDPDTGRPDRQTSIVFHEGRVTFIAHIPAPPIPPR